MEGCYGEECQLPCDDTKAQLQDSCSEPISCLTNRSHLVLKRFQLPLEFPLGFLQLLQISRNIPLLMLQNVLVHLRQSFRIERVW
jgi:hypothetical protein